VHTELVAEGINAVWTVEPVLVPNPQTCQKRYGSAAQRLIGEWLRVTAEGIVATLSSEA
jgi:hypothetical protein